MRFKENRTVILTATLLLFFASWSQAALKDCDSPFELDLGANQKLKFCKIPAAENVVIGSKIDTRSYTNRIKAPRFSPPITRSFESFYIGQFEVTKVQFATVTEYPDPWLRRRGTIDFVSPFITPWKNRERARKAMEIIPRNNVNYHEKAPAVGVTLGDIYRFIEQLEKIDPSANYRLPTEAEWEYAARGKKNRESDYYWGEKDIKDFAVYHRRRPMLVNQCPSSHLSRHWGPDYCANDFGLMHMLGNAAEMTADDYSGSYSDLPPTGNGHEVFNNEDYNDRWHMVRGGSFGNVSPEKLMVHSRGYTKVYEEPTYDFFHQRPPVTIGFRLIRIPHETLEEGVRVPENLATQESLAEEEGCLYHHPEQRNFDGSGRCAKYRD